MNTGDRVSISPTATGALPAPGSRFTTYESLRGQYAVVERELGDDERDPEVGRMFTVRASDGTRLDVFEDEITSAEFDTDIHSAAITVTFDYTDEQLAAVRARAAELDAHNLGSDDPPEWYTPALAFARVLASDENVTMHVMKYTDGYTAEPVPEER